MSETKKFYVLVAKPIHAGIFIAVDSTDEQSAVETVRKAGLDLNQLIQEPMVDINGDLPLVLNDTDMIDEAEVIGNRYYQGLDLQGVYSDADIPARRRFSYSSAVISLDEAKAEFSSGIEVEDEVSAAV